jgi:hypothetical protein
MTVLKPFGYQSGKVETFLKGFGFNSKKETPAEFCKRLWNVDINSKDEPTEVESTEEEPTEVES